MCYRYEKDYSKYKLHSKRSFLIPLAIAIVLNIIVFNLPKEVYDKVQILVMLSVGFFLGCIMWIFIGWLNNKQHKAFTKSGEQEYIEFHPDRIVIYERVNPLSSVCQYCYYELYYDEINMSVCKGTYPPLRLTSLNIYLKWNLHYKRSIIYSQNGYQRQNAHISLHDYPEEVTAIICNKFRHLLKVRNLDENRLYG